MLFFCNVLILFGKIESEGYLMKLKQKYSFICFDCYLSIIEWYQTFTCLKVKSYGSTAISK